MTLLIFYISITYVTRVVSRIVGSPKIFNTNPSPIVVTNGKVTGSQNVSQKVLCNRQFFTVRLEILLIWVKRLSRTFDDSYTFHGRFPTHRGHSVHSGLSLRDPDQVNKVVMKESLVKP